MNFSNHASVKLNGPGYPLAAIDRLVSVVIPVADEAGNILPLTKEIVDAMQNVPQAAGSYEIIYIDDKSTDGTRDEIMQAMQAFPQVRLICHQERYGKSQGVRTALRAARGAWIITMDGDRQNDPADIPSMIAAAWQNSTNDNRLVSGVRKNRQDTRSKRWASKLANNLRRALLNDNGPDTGCGFKMFRRDAWLALPYFDNIHRYEPALFQLYNVPVSYVPVNDRLRTHGVSKYTNWKRALDGIFDLAGVLWLQRRLRARNWQSVEIASAAATNKAAAE